MDTRSDTSSSIPYAPVAARNQSTNKWWTPALAVQLALIAVLLAWNYWHILVRLCFLWRTRADWSHGFIIPFFGLYYLYLRRDRMPTELPVGSASRWLGAAILIVSFLFYVFTTHLQQAYPQSVSLVMMILGVAMMLAGWPLTRWAWFAIAFLLFALPLPDRIYDQLTIPLRVIAARISAAMLGVLPDMIAEPQGTLVEYIYKGKTGTLDVEHACSGMRLLVTMSALGVAMAFLNERPLWQRLVIILACVPIAIFCNIVRVTTTGFLYVFGRDDLASGAPHMLLGLGMLLVAFALYSGINYVLGHLFVDSPEGKQA